MAFHTNELEAGGGRGSHRAAEPREFRTGNQQRSAGSMRQWPSFIML